MKNIGVGANMKCETCNEDLEEFGSIYCIEDNKKIKKSFGICTKHIPYTSIKLIKKEEGV